MIPEIEGIDEAALHALYRAAKAQIERDGAIEIASTRYEALGLRRPRCFAGPGGLLLALWHRALPPGKPVLMESGTGCELLLSGLDADALGVAITRMILIEQIFSSRHNRPDLARKLERFRRFLSRTRLKRSTTPL